MGARSGKWWVAWADVHARNSTQLADLEPKFRSDLQRFIQALVEAGATVEVWATRRSSERAYLFHWAWKIGLGMCQPAAAEPMRGVDIEWDHGDEQRSRAGALEMVSGFGLALPPQSLLPPALDSEHITGNAVDMDISWAGILKVRNRRGRRVAIAFMQDANANSLLHAVGASYGVKKLKNDAPHWSASGR